MGLLEAIVLSVIAASTPLLLAAAGELIAERAGVLNLGVEGMMIVGAACGFAGAYFTGSTLVGALAGAFAGVAMSAIFAALTLGLAVNQVATGLALTIFGIGLSGLIGSGFVGERIVPAPALDLPLLTGIPFVGRILFGQDGFVYLSIALVAGIWWFLYRTRAGLVLRAVGDNHTSAHALGYPVLRIRMLAGAVRRRLCRPGRRVSAARLHALLHSRHDRRPRLDCARPRGVLILAARPPRHRRLSVRRGDDPAASCAGRRPWHSFATDVVAALSRDDHRSGLDVACAFECRIGRARVPGSGVRARSINVLAARRRAPRRRTSDPPV